MSPFQDAFSVDVFISHGTVDRDIAELLIHLLRAAINIDPKRIRCTSVPGYQLRAGTSIDEELKKEIFDSGVFIALISRESLKSIYVLFELGARWGSERKLIPILAAGMSTSELRDPLRGLVALSCDNENDLDELVREVNRELGLKLNDYPFYKGHITNLRRLSSAEARKRSHPKEPAAKMTGPKAEIAKKLREALTINNRRRDWKSVSNIAVRAGVPEDEAYKVLQSMPDVILSATKDGRKIAKKGRS